jgi:hypothetical protein
MVLTDFTITAADVGRALGVPDGYLVNLVMTQGPAYETPSVRGQGKIRLGLFCAARKPRLAGPRLRLPGLRRLRGMVGIDRQHGR